MEGRDKEKSRGALLGKRAGNESKEGVAAVSKRGAAQEGRGTTVLLARQEASKGLG
jgi:hypothetical protein